MKRANIGENYDICWLDTHLGLTPALSDCVHSDTKTSFTTVPSTKISVFYVLYLLYLLPTVVVFLADQPFRSGKKTCNIYIPFEYRLRYLVQWGMSAPSICKHSLSILSYLFIHVCYLVSVHIFAQGAWLVLLLRVCSYTSWHCGVVGSKYSNILILWFFLIFLHIFWYLLRAYNTYLCLCAHACLGHCGACGFQRL